MYNIIVITRPLYGGGSGVCVYFVYVYIVLWFVGHFGMSLELTLLYLERLWASIWDPFGRLGLPRDSPWSHFGLPLAPLGCRWDHLGHLGLPSGAWDDFGSKIDVRLRYYLECLQCLRIKSDVADLSRGSAISCQSGARAPAPNPTSLAPGDGMTWV